MKNLLGGSAAENRTALTAGFIGGLLLGLSWLGGAPAFTYQQVGLAVVLAGCVVLADYFPIHIRYATKVSLISAPLYLAAVLLPRPLALVTAGVGIFAADWLTRASRGLLPLDFIQDPARWTIIMFCGSTLARFADLSTGLPNLWLVAAAAAMFLLDVITFSVFTWLDIREPLGRLISSGIAQMFDIEIVQYSIGILGALAYRQADWSLWLLAVPAVITYLVFKKGKELNHATRELLVNMADAVDLRDRYTGGHSRRVAELCGRILAQMGIVGIEVEVILTAARLHDIGKLGIPDTVLLKPEWLTPAEWEVMRSHPAKGAELLAGYANFARGAEMIRHHHEYWNGRGYPDGLKGRTIPFGARVIAVADAFDAMTTDRPYRRGSSKAEAAQVLLAGRYVQWDGEVVDALLAALRDELDEPAVLPVKPDAENPFVVNAVKNSDAL